MKVYIGHSKAMNYIDDLYKPVREVSENMDCTFILPHELDSDSQNDRSFYENIDLFIADVSLSATGLGIELGWAFDSNVPIICIFKSGSKVGGSLKSLTDKFYEYSDDKSLKLLLGEIVKSVKCFQE